MTRPKSSASQPKEEQAGEQRASQAAQSAVLLVVALEEVHAILQQPVPATWPALMNQLTR